MTPAEIKIADKDIVCYKVLIRKKEIGGNYSYRTAYMEQPIIMNKQYTEPLFEETIDNVNNEINKITYTSDNELRTLFTLYRYGENMLHLFVVLHSAEQECDNFNIATTYGYNKYVVVKAIIPKGTKYIEGYNGYFKNIGTKSVIYQPLDKE